MRVLVRMWVTAWRYLKYSYIRMLLVQRNSVQLIINLEVGTTITSEPYMVRSRPWKMAEKKNDDNDDKDPGQVHLVVRLAVPVCSHMGVLYPLVC